MVDYHDNEWGVPIHDDRQHFEHLVLDAFQAGLSWRTILHKRENFRRAFADFDPENVARFTKRRVDKLMLDAGIVRNRQKIEAAVNNARALLAVQQEVGSFDDFIWTFVDGRTKVNRWKSLSQLPTKSNESEAMSKELKHRGFRFCGPTICYAYMQAAGLVNDHEVGCFRYQEIVASLG